MHGPRFSQAVSKWKGQNKDDDKKIARDSDGIQHAAVRLRFFGNGHRRWRGGRSSAAKEGGIRGTVSDEAIRIQISDLWFRKDVNLFGKLNLNVNQGRVLVTGVVQKPEDRVEAIRMAWQPSGVRQVINEIRVGEGGTIGNYAQDVWISGQLRTKLTFDKYIQSINYSIETVRGAVYLMGVAQNQAELDRVIDIARKINGVKEVISYVKLAGESLGAPMAAMAPDTTGDTGNNDGYADQAPVQLSTGMENSPAASTSYTGSSSSIQSEVLPP